MTTPAELRGQVLRELNWDHRVPRYQVSVQVEDGVIILQGTVEHGAQRLAAQEAAHRVAGVHDVVNNIVVRYPVGLGHADAQVAMLVRRELDRHHKLPADRIHVTVSAGWVGLSGNVASARERREAERVVHTVDGVRGLTDDLRVEASHEALAPAG